MAPVLSALHIMSGRFSSAWQRNIILFNRLWPQYEIGLKFISVALDSCNLRAGSMLCDSLRKLANCLRLKV
jgi:hypothetical protein